MGIIATARVECANSLLPGLMSAGSKLFRAMNSRGYGWYNRLLLPLSSGKHMAYVWNDGSRFEFPAGDSYWNRHCDRGFDYEPEMEAALKRIAGIDYLFIDAGANMGFWSVLVSSPMFGGRKAVAIEGSRETFERLERNRIANGGRFETLFAAVYSEAGRELVFSTGSHAGRHLDLDAAAQGTPVTTVTLDGIAAARRDGLPVVIKLDVEGAEPDALKGAAETLKGDVLLIYEDHGKDRDHAISRLLAGDHGMALLAMQADGKARRIRDFGELDAIKTNPRIGYNFLACRPDSVFLPALA